MMRHEEDWFLNANLIDQAREEIEFLVFFRSDMHGKGQYQKAQQSDSDSRAQKLISSIASSNVLSNAISGLNQ